MKGYFRYIEEHESKKSKSVLLNSLIDMHNKIQYLISNEMDRTDGNVFDVRFTTKLANQGYKLLTRVQEVIPDLIKEFKISKKRLPMFQEAIDITLQNAEHAYGIFKSTKTNKEDKFIYADAITAHIHDIIKMFLRLTNGDSND